MQSGLNFTHRVARGYALIWRGYRTAEPALQRVSLTTLTCLRAGRRM